MWNLTAGRQVRQCGYPHLMPAWWPRITITWADLDGIRPDVRVNACIRHTGRAFDQLRYMGTPSKVNAQREAQARAALRELLAAQDFECRWCREAIVAEHGAWAWAADYGDDTERRTCEDSPHGVHAPDLLLAAHASHDLPVIGCTAATDPGTLRERYADVMTAREQADAELGASGDHESYTTDWPT